MGTSKATLRLQITPDEDIRLECGNVASRMQFDWALYQYINTTVTSENMTDFIGISKLLGGWPPPP
jgi:hypothetical protein